MTEKQMKIFDLYPCFLALLLLYCLWFLTRRLFLDGRNKKLPPSPPKLPIIGNLHQLGRLPHRSLTYMSRKYGPLMSLQLGSRSALVISSAAVAKEVVKNHDISISDIPVVTAAKRIFYGGKGLIFYGENWKQLRSMFVNHLLHKSMIKCFKSIRDAEASRLLEHIDKCSSTSAPVNWSVRFKHMSIELICNSAFGTKFLGEEETKEILGMIDITLEFLSTFTVGEFIPRLSWMNRWNGFDATLDKLVKEKEELLGKRTEEYIETSCGDCNFVDILIGLGLHIEDIQMLKAIIQDILGTGTDPPSTTLDWAMTELIRNPNSMKKLQEEVTEIMKGKQEMTDNELEKMQYLKAVIKETLRLHPPVPVKPRETNEDVHLMGYDIPAGTMVMFNLSAICRDPACWDQPETFSPDRFLNSSINYKGLDFQFIPFGVGRRICPGMFFAMVSIEHVLANLVHKFEWRLPDGAQGKDLDVAEKPGFTIGRKKILLL
ncbi:cytochrome P450 Tp4149-like [Andrographis paniculata]|uniref:cytochrome P450 Tp4149-like n=1 Tax=Andrographis paniculata TaxID=175694 RepID=UPI0021E8C7C3|nr:cytochrome P450 Tp4149-like [Andrographis paniculata]